MPTLEIAGLAHLGGLPRGAGVMIFEAHGGDWESPIFREVDSIARVAGSKAHREVDPGRYFIRIYKHLGGRQHLTYKYEVLIGLLEDGGGCVEYESHELPLKDPLFIKMQANFKRLQNLAPKFSRSMFSSDGLVYRCEWGGGMCDLTLTSRTGAILHEFDHIGVSPFRMALVDMTKAEQARNAAALTARQAAAGRPKEEGDPIVAKGTGGKHIVDMTPVASQLRPTES